MFQKKSLITTPNNIVPKEPFIRAPDAFSKVSQDKKEKLDLGAKTYLKSGKPVFNKLRNYIDSLAKFKGADWGGIRTINKIKSKVLELGIPRGASAEQLAQINNATAYAKSINVELIVRIIK